MKKEVIVASNNKDKIREIKEILKKFNIRCFIDERSRY